MIFGRVEQETIARDESNGLVLNSMYKTAEHRAERLYPAENKSRTSVIKINILRTRAPKVVAVCVYVCTKYVCIVITNSRVWINQVRLSILLVVK